MLSGGFKYILVLTILCVFHACGKRTVSNEITQNIDTVSTRLLDSLETVAYQYPERYIQQADSFVNQIEGIIQRVEDKVIYAYILMNVAYSLKEHGNLYESIKYYEKAYQYVHENKLADIDIAALVIKPLANLYTRIDDIEKTVGLLEHALSETSEPQQKIALLNNLALAYLYLPAPQKSISLSHQSLSLGPRNTLTEALIYNNLANAYQQIGNRDSCYLFNKKAIAIFEHSSLQADTLSWYTSALLLRGELNESPKDFETALRLLNNASNNGYQREKAKINLQLAELYTHSKRPGDSKKYFTESLALLSPLRDPNGYVTDYTYTHALTGIADNYEFVHDNDSAFYYYRLAIENDFRTQQLITGREGHLKNNKSSRQRVEKMLSTASRLLGNTTEEAIAQEILKTCFWLTELSKGRLLINEISRSSNWSQDSTTLGHKLNRLQHIYRQIHSVQDNPLKKELKREAQQLLLELQIDEKFYEKKFEIPDINLFSEKIGNSTDYHYTYFTNADSSLYILSCNNGTYRLHKVGNSIVKTVDTFKSTYFGHSPQAYNNDPKAYDLMATTICSALLPQLPQRDGTLFISTDGSLSGLPFDALRQGNEFLVEHYNLSYLHTFILKEYISPPILPPSKINILYRSNYTPPLPNLLFADQEAQELQRRYQTAVYSEERQSIDDLQSAFAARDILHIAAHTSLDDNNSPMIYLRTPLSIDQIKVSWIGSPLIFLSACNTASGENLTSEGMESLTRAFLTKGVPSVLATYWLADDEATLDITTTFYSNLLQEKNPINALGQAKRAFIAHSNEQGQNPWYWANINHSGIDTEILLTQKRDLTSLLISALILSLLAIAGYSYRRLRSNGSLVKINEESEDKP